MKEFRNTLIFTATVVLGMASMQCFAKPADQEKDQLEAVIGFEKVSNSYYVTVKSSSDEFICLSSEQFDTGGGAISLHGADGKAVALRSYRDPGPPLMALKFNFAEPYFFLRPHESRKVYIDTSNFIASASVYAYDIILTYYRCRDITDLARIKANKEIPGQSLHARGSIDMGLRQK